MKENHTKRFVPVMVGRVGTSRAQVLVSRADKVGYVVEQREKAVSGAHGGYDDDGAPKRVP